MGRVNKQTIEARIDAVRLLLLAGKEPAEIARDSSAKWGVTERQVFNYVSTAQERIRGILEVDRVFRTAEALTLRRDLRQRARKTGDIRAELEVLKDEAKLLGLYAPDQSEVKLEVDDTRAEVRSRIDSLATRLRAGSSDDGTGGDTGSRGGPGA